MTDWYPFRIPSIDKWYPFYIPTILDKTDEKIVYLGSIFLNIVAVPVLYSPPSPESDVVVYSKRKPDPWAFVGSNIELGEGDFFPQRRRLGNSFVV